jgi:hypothetical protein
VSGQRTYPIASAHELATALADEPVLVDGMKVVFDIKVGLYPVSLQKPETQTDDEWTNGS